MLPPKYQALAEHLLAIYLILASQPWLTALLIITFCLVISELVYGAVWLLIYAISLI